MSWKCKTKSKRTTPKNDESHHLVLVEHQSVLRMTKIIVAAASALCYVLEMRYKQK